LILSWRCLVEARSDFFEWELEDSGDVVPAAALVAASLTAAAFSRSARSSWAWWLSSKRRISSSAAPALGGVRESVISDT
jgi:hypothetical protein